jgi:hypothetical protein
VKPWHFTYDPLVFFQAAVLSGASHATSSGGDLVASRLPTTRGCYVATSAICSQVCKYHQNQFAALQITCPKVEGFRPCLDTFSFFNKKLIKKLGGGV